VEVLEQMGHHCYFLAGQSKTQPSQTMIVPELFFLHPDIRAIYNEAFNQPTRRPETTEKIRKITRYIKKQLYDFVRTFEIELLLVENALAIPLNIPLGQALTEFIVETGMWTIAHHHDFFWERKQFLVNCVWDYLNMSFPPHLPSIHHVVINSSAANQLSLRTGISSTLIPNVMDFDCPLPPPDEYTQDLRSGLEMLEAECLFLQPTRVVQRKGIEHAIEFTHRLGMNARLVITHAAGDEGYEYEQRLRDYARLLNVKINFVSQIIQPQRGITSDGRKIYALADVYPNADLVTYPSDLEGFGNAFLEAIYFRKPILVNNYSIYSIDIKPKGFQVIEFDGYIVEDTLRQARQLLENPGLMAEMAEHNFQRARKYYSYKILERHLHTLLVGCFGENA
jgi:glycosyltransferase involved in cell wall biosynthesis